MSDSVFEVVKKWSVSKCLGCMPNGILKIHPRFDRLHSFITIQFSMNWKRRFECWRLKPFFFVQNCKRATYKAQPMAKLPTTNFIICARFFFFSRTASIRSNRSIRASARFKWFSIPLSNILKINIFVKCINSLMCRRSTNVRYAQIRRKPQNGCSALSRPIIDKTARSDCSITALRRRRIFTNRFF